MNSIRLQNFKSIRDSGEIKLAPITIVVGRNSCGKSSLLRSLPLFRQSAESPIKDSILWYGNDVDLCDFQTVLTKGLNPERESIIISFGFSFKMPRRHDINQRISDDVRERSVSAKIELRIQKDSIIGYTIKSDGNLIDFTKTGENRCRVTINNQEIPNLNRYVSIRRERTFLPIPHFGPRKIEGVNMPPGDDDMFEFVFLPLYRAGLIDGGTWSLGDVDGVFSLIERSEENKAAIIDAFASTKFDVFKEKAAKIIFTNDSMKDNVAILFAPILQRIVRLISRTLEQEFSSISYIAPMRASGNRFYRVRGSDASSVAPDGINAPMILFYMSEREKREFTNWSRENFGFWFEIQNSGSFVSVLVCDETGNNVNMTDAGFGYSQILPIILSLWLSTNPRQISARRMNPMEIVIEQPELHLHPAMQAKLIATFAKIASMQDSSRPKVKFLIETHSETMINVLGQMISRNQLDTKDVNVVICNKKDNISSFEETAFSEDGMLKEWPIGFFSPDNL